MQEINQQTATCITYNVVNSLSPDLCLGEGGRGNRGMVIPCLANGDLEIEILIFDRNVPLAYTNNTRITDFIRGKKSHFNKR